MRLPPVRRRLIHGLLALGLLGSLGLPAARAQSADLVTLALQRQDGDLLLDFEARVALPKLVEDALQRGVPVYFVAQATLYRYRWYWRDERIARVQRVWRIAYQPLTSNWRLGFGGFNQTFASLGEALGAASRSSRWKVADLSQIEPDTHYYLEFSWRLDNSQLPSPMQLGLGGQSEWALGVERTLRVD